MNEQIVRCLPVKSEPTVIYKDGVTLKEGLTFDLSVDYDDANFWLIFLICGEEWEQDWTDVAYWSNGLSWCLRNRLFDLWSVFAYDREMDDGGKSALHVLIGDIVRQRVEITIRRNSSFNRPSQTDPIEILVSHGQVVVANIEIDPETAAKLFDSSLPK